MDKDRLRRIITKVKERDKMAFGELMDHYYRYAERVAYRILTNREDTEDAIQNTFVKVWENADRYNEKFEFTTWLYRIIINTSLDLLRKKRKFPTDRETNISGIYLHENAGENEADHPMIQNEVLEIFRLLSENLAPTQKAVFVLRDLEALPAEEVAEILNMSSDQVKSNLYHARKKLRELYSMYMKKEESNGMR